MNLQTIFKFCCCFIICLIHTTATTTITPTSNEVLFKPLGQLIPELSWGTVRVHINMSDIFTETNYICNASRLMDTEWAKMKRKYGSGFSGIPPTKLNSRSAYLSESLKKDITFYILRALSFFPFEIEIKIQKDFLPSFQMLNRI